MDMTSLFYSQPSTMSAYPIYLRRPLFQKGDFLFATGATRKQHESKIGPLSLLSTLVPSDRTYKKKRKK